MNDAMFECEHCGARGYKEAPRCWEKGCPQVETDVQHDSHYRNFAIQPMQYCLKNNMDPVQSALIGYITRWHLKGQKKRDMEAARNMIQQALEYEESGEWPNQ